MSQFRCSKCRQLQFKYHLKGDRLEIETKCYNDNEYNYFTVWLNKTNVDIKKNNEKELKK